MSRAALDAFGDLLMKHVRDEAITEWDAIIEGRMKGITAERVRATLTSFDAQQLDVLQRLIPDIVDSVLHHLLWALEQAKGIDIAVHSKAGTVSSLRDVSDGLEGELYGWIPKFSLQRYDTTFYET